MHVPLGNAAGLGVVDAPVRCALEDGLRLDADHADVAVFEVALLLNRGEEAFIRMVALPEVPAEDGGGDHLAIAIGVVLRASIAERLREQHAEHAPLQVQRTEGEEKAVRLGRLRGREETLLLLDEELAGALQLREFSEGVGAKEPGVPGPVSGVVAPGEEERNPTRDEVAERGDDHAADDEAERDERAPDCEEARVRVVSRRGRSRRRR